MNKVQHILSKLEQNGDRKVAENEIMNARKEFKITNSWLVNYEVSKLVDQHFDVHQNGTVIDLIESELAKGDSGNLQAEFGIDDERFNNIRSKVS